MIAIPSITLIILIISGCLTSALIPLLTVKYVVRKIAAAHKKEIEQEQRYAKFHMEQADHNRQQTLNDIAIIINFGLHQAEWEQEAMRLKYENILKEKEEHKNNIAALARTYHKYRS